MLHTNKYTPQGVYCQVWSYAQLNLPYLFDITYISKATVRKMKQNLFWASIYNVLAIPVAGGILYPGFGVMLRPEFAALLMSVSSIIVATNAVLLKRVEKNLIAV